MWHVWGRGAYKVLGRTAEGRRPDIRVDVKII